MTSCDIDPTQVNIIFNNRRVSTSLALDRGATVVGPQGLIFIRQLHVQMLIIYTDLANIRRRKDQPAASRHSAQQRQFKTF